MIPKMKQKTSKTKVEEAKSKTTETTETTAILRTRLPKTEYDKTADRPILNIPGIDDEDLGSAVDSFLYNVDRNGDPV